MENIFKEFDALVDKIGNIDIDNMMSETIAKTEQIKDEETKSFFKESLSLAQKGELNIKKFISDASKYTSNK